MTAYLLANLKFHCSGLSRGFWRFISPGFPLSRYKQVLTPKSFRTIMPRPSAWRHWLLSALRPDYSPHVLFRCIISASRSFLQLTDIEYLQLLIIYFTELTWLARRHRHFFRTLRASFLEYHYHLIDDGIRSLHQICNAHGLFIYAHRPPIPKWRQNYHFGRSTAISLLTTAIISVTLFSFHATA
jgi:hypothetical protein